MTPSTFVALGSRCTLRDPVNAIDLDATVYDAICRANGDPFQRRIMIMKTDMGIALIQKGAGISLLRKCD